jgi:hypothetical protein
MHLAVPYSVRSAECNNGLSMLKSKQLLCWHEVIAGPVLLHLCISSKS